MTTAGPHTLRLMFGALALLVGFFTVFGLDARGADDTNSLAPLQALRSEAKFTPHDFYTGADTPEDGVALIALVNETIDDILAMPRPLDRNRVRARLTKLINKVDFFATEDREEAYRYAVRAWRAAGFTGESKLFWSSDDSVLARP